METVDTEDLGFVYEIGQLDTFDPGAVEATVPSDYEHQFTEIVIDATTRDQQDLCTFALHSKSDCSDRLLLRQMATSDLTQLKYRNPTFKQAARLIVHSLSAFPHMMLRRQTFPPFIHGYWHKSELPEPLANCMSIAQLFAARTPETRQFLWRTIENEEKRFRDEYENLSAAEIQPPIQAMLIYMIMAIIDQDSETQRRGARMLETTQIICGRFLGLVGGYSTTEKDQPSQSWEDWVFAESRRRVSCLWFIFSCVVSVEAEIPCAGCGKLDNLPLLSSKTLWEAKSYEEWQIEKAFYDLSSPARTLVELVKARKDPYNPVHQQMLQTWESGTDKMAMMLNIAMEFVYS